MPALEQVRVFEVDHPDTQAWKRDLASCLPLAEADGGMQWHERIWVGQCGSPLA